jgi:hypothetical protein
LDIGSRLELFVDDFMIAEMEGVTRKLHSPQPQEVAIRFDSPWDGALSAYVTIFQDGGKFRMYYRGRPMPRHMPNMTNQEFWRWISKNWSGGSVACYAESDDGIHWKKPNLGLFECSVTGDKNNSIVLVTDKKRWPNATDNFVAFLDTNPAAPPEARYKGIGRHFMGGGYHTGSKAFQSPDGIHWSLMQEEAIHVDRGHTHDAQNIVFWDAYREHYVEYHRKFRGGFRETRTSTSKDFLNWTEQKHVEFGGAPREHFNNLLVLPYYRAPHIYLGFGSRLNEKRDDSFDHPAGGIDDGVFLSSRDGVNFDRSFMEAWIRPGLDIHNWMHLGTSPAWGLLQTGPEELSVYWLNGYYQSDCVCHVRRGALRLDGFVSVNAPYAGGVFTTKPFKFDGRELVINFSTSVVGTVRIELQHPDGSPIKGFTMDDCPEIYGDKIEKVVGWKGGSDVSSLARKPIQMRVYLKDADLYSFRFKP